MPFYRSLSSIIHNGSLPRQCRRRYLFLDLFEWWCSQPEAYWLLTECSDFNWLISPIDFLNRIVFSANFFWVKISFQLIFPKASFLLSSTHNLYPFLVGGWRSIGKSLVDCSTRRMGTWELRRVKVRHFSCMQILHDADSFRSQLYYWGASRFAKTFVYFFYLFCRF